MFNTPQVEASIKSMFLPDLKHQEIKELQQKSAAQYYLPIHFSDTSNIITPWYVTKGGSWFDDAIHSRRAARKKRSFEEMDTNLGFRVVREIV